MNLCCIGTLARPSLFTVFPHALIPNSINGETYAQFGQDFMLECQGLGGPGNNYQWQFNGEFISGERSPMLELSLVAVSNGGVYTCIVVNPFGADATNTLLIVSPYLVSEPVDVLADNGVRVDLLCGAVGFPTPTYQWWRADGELIRDGIVTDSPTLTFDPVMYGDEGDYFCVASSLQASNSSQVATITSNCTIKTS